MSRSSVMGTIISLSFYIVCDILLKENADNDLENCQKCIWGTENTCR